ncbi:ABC transporter substrate-binding protein [Paradesulfitobacterium aromaticivorans]
MKKKVLAFTLIALLLLSVAGCGQQAATSTSDTSNPPIVLGVPTALGTIEGADSLKAVQLAVEEINAQGGINVGGVKRMFKVESIDTREAEPNVPMNDALSALQKLIDEKKPSAIVVGAFRSEVLMAEMDLIAKAKIPYIDAIASTPEFEKNVASKKDSYKYMFRANPSSVSLVSNLYKSLDYIGKQFKMNKVYFITQDVAWANATTNGVEKMAKDNGWTVVGHDAYPGGSADFSSSLAKAKNAGTEVIVPMFDMPESGNLLKQAKAMKVPALLAGFISPVAPESAGKTFGSDVNGLVNLLFESGPLSVKALPKTVTFLDGYGKKYGQEARNKMAGHGPGPAYDSVYMIAEAIKRAGSVEPDAVVAALEKTDMDGVIGHIKFNENHQVIYGTDPKATAISAVFQWLNGVRVPVFPEGIAEGKIELPTK